MAESAGPAAEELLVILGPDDRHRITDIPDGIACLQAARSVFPDGEQLVIVPNPGTIRARHILVVQTTAPPQDMRLITACQLSWAAAEAGAASVTCFLPYLCYQRQDRISAPGQALSALVVLRLLYSAGVRTILTVDRHSMPPWDGQPGLPRVTSMGCADAVAAAVREQGTVPDYVVAADRGGTGRASAIAGTLGVPLVVLGKLKSSARGTHYDTLPDCLRGRSLLVVDDVCTSGSTIRPLCAELRALDAWLTVFITHLVPTPEGRVTAIDGVGRFLYSDTCGDPAASIRVMPLALRYWSDALDGRGPGGHEPRHTAANA